MGLHVRIVIQAMLSLEVKYYDDSFLKNDLCEASQKCTNCSKNAGYYIRFLSYLVIQILIIIFATKYFLCY